MKKKKVLLLVSIASVALLSATAAVVFSGKANTARLSADDIPPYQIEFTEADCLCSTQEEDDTHYYVDFFKENGIGGKYDIGSTVGDSYGNADSLDNFDFSDPDCIFTIIGSSEWSIQVTFELIPRATLITDASYMTIELGDNKEPQYVYDFIETSEYDGKKHYECSYSGTETARFVNVVLAFSC